MWLTSQNILYTAGNPTYETIANWPLVVLIISQQTQNAIMLTLLLVNFSVSYAYPADNLRYNSTVIQSPALQRRAGGDPTLFDWVHRFAAIGDSFTAGIGSGSPLGNLFYNKNDWSCSRYDAAYPPLIYQWLGPSVENFQYPACSGDRSEGIYKQARGLGNAINLLVMTAGGNDLCLVCQTLSFNFRRPQNKMLTTYRPV
jgi:hypothetical protein